MIDKELKPKAHRACHVRQSQRKIPLALLSSGEVGVLQTSLVATCVLHAGRQKDRTERRKERREEATSGRTTEERRYRQKSGDEVFWGERMKDPSEVTGSPQNPPPSPWTGSQVIPATSEVICFGSPQMPRITN